MGGYPFDIRAKADEEQQQNGIELNPGAAIQKAIAAFSDKHNAAYQIVTEEFDVQIDYKGKPAVVRVQKAEDIGGKRPLYFAAFINIWTPVYVTDGTTEFVEWDKYVFQS